MNDDIGLLQWLVGGVMVAASGIGAVLYQRDEKTREELKDFKTHVAGNYMPRDQITQLVKEIREDMRHINDRLEDLPAQIIALMDKRK